MIQTANARSVLDAIFIRSEQIRLENVIRRSLLNSGYASLRFITCDYEDGVATLLGQTPSFYLKQIAQTIVAELDGVERVENKIMVPTGESESAPRD